MGWLGEVAVVGLVLDDFVDEVGVGVGVAQQVMQGCVAVGGGAGAVVTGGDGLLLGEVGGEPPAVPAPGGSGAPTDPAPGPTGAGPTTSPGTVAPTGTGPPSVPPTSPPAR